MKRIFCITFITSLLVAFFVGCDDKFLDPTNVGRFRPVPAVNVILDTLGVSEETPAAWVGAEDPKPSDLTFYETDYTFGPGDVVRVNIFELLQEGQPFFDDYTVTETGNISLPSEIGIVNVAGLTENQLEEEIKRILSPRILKEPIVTVTLLGSQKYFYSISGEGISQSGRNPFPRTNFRLSDALAVAGGVSQFNTTYIYVTRLVTGKEAASEKMVPQEKPQIKPEEKPQEKPQEPKITPKDEMLEIIAPRAKKPADNGLVIVSAEMATGEGTAQSNQELTDVAAPTELQKDQGQQSDWIFDKETGKWIEVKKQQQPKGQLEMNPEELLPTMPEKTEPNGQFEPQQQPVERQQEIKPQPSERETIEEPIRGADGKIEWIFQDGKWVPKQIGEPNVQQEPVMEPLKEEPLKPVEPVQTDLEQIGTGGVQTRVIKIPVDGLYGGSPQFDIAIRPGDRIYVPRDIVGEFYVDGHVNNRGVINLTGRPMTLKMAIAASGGLGPLAWPKHCEVIRRISKNKEEIVMVDLDKIASGEQPDFFIKPHDEIRVGTHETSRFRAVLRNAFRATYGFGFLYDRNFNDRPFGFEDPLGPFGIGD